MDNYEVLVHIAAPSGFRDDKRYSTQAEAVARFEAAVVTNIYGGSEEEIRAGRNASTVSLVRSSDEQSHTANKQNPQPDPNPPTIRAVRTPDALRPQTAPTGDVGLPTSNPFARWTTRKRAHSELSSFDGFSSVVPETQQVATASINCGGPSTQYTPPSDPSKTQDRAIMKHTQEADDKGALRKRVRLGEVSRLETDAATDLPAGHNERQMPPYLLRDRSLDWTSSPEPSSSGKTKTSTTLTATATPSQPLPDVPRQSRPETTPKAKEVYTYHNPTSPIDLISQDPQSTPLERLPPLSPQPASPSSPAVMTSTSRSPISALSTHIFPPPPPTGHGIYVSHITPALAVTVKRLPIAKRFRPVQVSRDVRVLERGHWHIPITIASQAVVDEARTEMSKDQKLAKITKQRDAPTSRERWKRQDVWTEEEFVRFWRNLEECVGEGKWGWGVKVFREECTEEADEVRKPHDDLPSSPPEASAVGAERKKKKRVLLKVTTWGELIPHIWILLWLISDKLTAYIPMEWRAGDDSVVVKMSGYRRKHGILGEWVYKGPEGEMGVWGIAEAKAIEHSEPGKG